MADSGERRKRRSGYKDLALEVWLDTVARRHDVPVLVVADGSGLLVAAGRDAVEAEEIAALAATLVCPVGEVATCSHRGATVWARRVAQVEEQILVLAKGAAGPAHAALAEADPGVTRILAERLRQG